MEENTYYSQGNVMNYQPDVDSKNKINVIALILSIACFVLLVIVTVIIYINVSNPSYTYYDAYGNAVAVVEYGGDDLVSTWNACAYNTSNSTDEQKAIISERGQELIFNDFVLKVSSTKAKLVTNPGTDEQVEYATIKSVKTTNEDGETVETSIEECVENLASTITGGSYTVKMNSWILRFFK